MIYCECNGCGVKTKGVKAIAPDDMDDFWEVNKSNTQIAKDNPHHSIQIIALQILPLRQLVLFLLLDILGALRPS